MSYAEATSQLIPPLRRTGTAVLTVGANMVSIIEEGEEVAEENDRLIISQSEESYVGVADSDEQDQSLLITAANKLSVEKVEKHLQNEDFTEEIKN